MPNKLIGRVVLGDHDRELVFEFFALVMSFEWALKRFGWLIDSNPGARAEAGWKEYAETLRGRLLVRPEIATAIALLREHPPKEQCVTEDHQLGWREVRHEAGVSDEWRMLHLVKTVRNNLFHGGKYPDPSGPIEEPARNRPLLLACITILKTCLELSPRLKEQFAQRD